MSLGQVRHELFAKNFTCPDFHTCSMVETLKACEDYLSSGVEGVCKPVSTNFVEMVGKSCGFKGRSICFEPTDVTHAGPDKVMVLVHNEFNEKVYNYVSENFTALALGGLGALALAYGSYKLIKHVTATPKYLETASKDQLERSLKNAKVSNGHWNGSQIRFEGETEKATFSQVSRRIEELYSASVDFMRKKQETYEWSQKPTKSKGIGLMGLVVSAPFMMAEGVVKTLASGRPELSSQEERRVRDAMEWRKNRYAQLSSLFKESQDQLNASSYLPTRLWDRTLDKLSSWREASLTRDNTIFQEMLKNR